MQDASGQAVTASEVVTGHRANLYLGLSPAEWCRRRPAVRACKVVAFDAEGKRRAATAKLTSPGAATTAASGETTAAGSCKRETTRSPPSTAEVAVPADGDAAVAERRCADAGAVRAARRGAATGAGPPRSARDLIYVVGPGDGLFERRRQRSHDGDRLEAALPAGRRRRAWCRRRSLPGALALVTVERDGVMRYQVKRAGRGRRPSRCPSRRASPPTSSPR